MNPLFHPQLVNGPWGDPVLYIEFKFDRRAILFDLGEVRLLPSRKLLKVTHVFVSHTHMDHFIGFDHLLRVCLGREKMLFLYGPPQFIDQLESKLKAYSWNLVENFPNKLVLVAREYWPDRVLEAHFPIGKAFQKTHLRETIKPFDGRLYEEDAFYIRSVILDHKIPSLAFSLEERCHLNILKTGLAEMGLPKGLWLKELKEAIWRGERDDFPVRVWSKDREGFRECTFALGHLKKKLINVTPGQKIGYVVDTVLNEKTEKEIVRLIRGSDLLFIEAAFLEQDRNRAREKCHLTAAQAGRLARQAGVKGMVPIHFSPKYSRNPNRIEREAQEGFWANNQ
jgi:ribonuclease Z